MYLGRMGLKVTGSHIYFDKFQSNLDEMINYNLKIESPYLICLYASYVDRDDFIEKFGLINKIEQKCKENRLEFCYHNHAHEYKLFSGVYRFDIL